MTDRKPFEEQHILQVALKKCKLLEHSLLMMMVQVNMLKNKYNSYPYILSDSNIMKKTSSLGGTVSPKNGSNNDMLILGSFKKNHKYIRFSVYISRSLQMISRNHSEMNVNIIKIKRNVEASLTKVEHIVKKHCKRNSILFDLPSHCDDSLNFSNCHACCLLHK